MLLGLCISFKKESTHKPDLRYSLVRLPLINWVRQCNFYSYEDSLNSAERWLEAETAAHSSTKEWQDFTRRTHDFVEKFGPAFPIACVTSGGTTAPLELNTVRFIDNFR